ncbi:MAG: glycine cleavage system aminomethyltransferase GcvT [Haloferacaceae archaeon]
MPLHSPIRESHDDRGARFTEFGGWEMPVQFDSVLAEHAAVRERVGKFDVSHMGRIEVAGPDATELMQRLTSNDVSALDPGDAQYATITDADGLILDDTVVYRLPAGANPRGSADEAGYLFVPNAGHDAAMVDRWTSHREQWGLDATVRNVTRNRGMVAVQGPDAEETVAALAATPGRVRKLARFGVTAATVAGVDCLLARTGYTGEDGFELLPPWDATEALWNAFDCQPCGLGARDTLRIEMGYLLAGQEFDPETEPRNPYEAGVGFTVALDTEFVGRQALARVASEGVAERLVGFRLLERGVPRSGYDLTDETGDPLGHVTSGTMSPTLEEPIGLGYLPVAHADPETRVSVRIRGELKPAVVTNTPFLER